MSSSRLFLFVTGMEFHVTNELAENFSVLVDLLHMSLQRRFRGLKRTSSSVEIPVDSVPEASKAMLSAQLLEPQD
jgi:hypothetical protein